jgi:hypothetical protein
VPCQATLPVLRWRFGPRGCQTTVAPVFADAGPPLPAVRTVPGQLGTDLGHDIESAGIQCGLPPEPGFYVTWAALLESAPADEHVAGPADRLTQPPESRHQPRNLTCCG